MTQPFSGKTYQIPLASVRRLPFRGVGITAHSVLLVFSPSGTPSGARTTLQA
jgi:hypothetical protein